MANEITKAKWMTGSYQYQLNLGAKVEDPKGVITPLTLTPAKNVSVKIDNTEYALTLQGVKFSRKIYEPGLIEAEVAISPMMEVEPTTMPVAWSMKKYFPMVAPGWMSTPVSR